MVVLAACSDGSEATPETPELTATARPALATPRATGTTTATASETATVRPTVIATVTVTATAVVPPYRVSFEAGKSIDVSPAVVFVDPDTGSAEAWVIPGADAEFGVAPSGSYVIYRRGDGYRLLRTDDGGDRAIEVDSRPIEFGLGDSGFVATTQGRFVISVFDGRGDHLGELWLGSVSTRTAVSWAPDGKSIAHAIYPGSGSGLQLTIRSLADWSTTSVGAGTSLGGVSLKWSHDSERIAVVTEDRLRVFSREGELLGEFEGRFGGYWGNPRWSSDDAHLYVNQMPGSGGELAYLFTADAEAVLRFFTQSYAGGCGGEQWVDAETIEFGEHDVRLDGTFELHGRESVNLYPRLDSYGVILPEEFAFHLPHYGAGNMVRWTSDGRLVFTTPSVGHGGCGEGWIESLEAEPKVEWPPYDDPR
jgi:hypothetical protein